MGPMHQCLINFYSFFFSFPAQDDAPIPLSHLFGCISRVSFSVSLFHPLSTRSAGGSMEPRTIAELGRFVLGKAGRARIHGLARGRAGSQVPCGQAGSDRRAERDLGRPHGQSSTACVLLHRCAGGSSAVCEWASKTRASKICRLVGERAPTAHGGGGGGGHFGHHGGGHHGHHGHHVGGGLLGGGY